MGALTRRATTSEACLRYLLKNYAESKGMTLKENATLDDLIAGLSTEGLDYISDLFPGVTVDPREMVKLMASR